LLIQTVTLREPTALNQSTWGGGCAVQAAKTSGRVFAMADQWNRMDDPDAGEMDILARVRRP